MRKPRCDGEDTRRNLLKAASEIFAAKGFWEATTAEICKKAGANSAAINYHFRSKEALYVESWRYSFTQTSITYPLEGNLDPQAPPEERLRGRILAIMKRIIDPTSYDLDIVHKEVANPTGLLVKSMEEMIDPIFAGFWSIVRELLGEEASEQDAKLCLMSVRAQCFGPLLHERHRRLSQHPPRIPERDQIECDVDTLADHVTRFSLAGIREVKLKIALRNDS